MENCFLQTFSFFKLPKTEIRAVLLSKEELWYTDGKSKPLKRSKNMYMFQFIDVSKSDVLHLTMTSDIIEKCCL